MPVIDYAEVLASQDGRAHLLLGNGFSIACDPVFRYESLYQRAVDKGLSARAQAVFARLGTNNFEGVMRLLNDGDWVARNYGLITGAGSEMLADLDIAKRALVEAIAESHLGNSGSVSDGKKRFAREFFSPYHNVLTTNYDLLAYWVVMSEVGGVRYRDGFGNDPEEPDAPHVVFSFHLADQRGLLYLHGGLHLFVNSGHVTKHCWSRSGDALTTLIRAGLAEGKYPLFVAEGTPEKKLEQIYSSSYLSYAFDKMTRLGGRLVVFGSSLSATDAHIRNAIAKMKNLKELFIGVHDTGDTTEAEAAAAAIALARADYGFRDLDIKFYAAASANVWAEDGNDGEEATTV